MLRTDIRLGLPSKGLLGDGAMDFLAACGLQVYRPNLRQYTATIPALPEVSVIFQRPSDIVISVSQGSVDFGITGLDVLEEQRGVNGEDGLLTLHDDLGFGGCRLALAVPDSWNGIVTMADLAAYNAASLKQRGTPLRIATKFPRLTIRYLKRCGIEDFKLVPVAGTLEIAPAIGYADLIADLVSTGTTLRDNHLRLLTDGVVLESQACLIGNWRSLAAREPLCSMARTLLEFFEAHRRASGCYLLTANIRGRTASHIAQLLGDCEITRGLQGPTIAPVYPTAPESEAEGWYAVSIVIRKSDIALVMRQLRSIGGSGVIVTPVTYIFEEAPARYLAMREAISAIHSEDEGGDPSWDRIRNGSW